MAFFHPSPSSTFHVLIIPKRDLPRLEELKRSDIDFVTDLYQTVQRLAHEFELDNRGYQLITNGGEYQEVGQLHFHLVSD